MSEIRITMRLFGAFRKYGESVAFTAPAGATVKTIKQRLAETLKLSDAALVHDSVIANDNEIMDADAVLTVDASLAILPPVCGG